MKTILNKEFTQLCLNKYKDMVELGQTEELLDQENLGGIKVIINPLKKPEYILGQFSSEDERNNEVYIGA